MTYFIKLIIYWVYLQFGAEGKKQFCLINLLIQIEYVFGSVIGLPSLVFAVDYPAIHSEHRMSKLFPC